VHHFVLHRIRDTGEENAMNRIVAALIGLAAVAERQY
jgi:hypothetical protein